MRVVKFITRCYYEWVGMQQQAVNDRKQRAIDLSRDAARKELTARKVQPWEHDLNTRELLRQGWENISKN